MAPRPATADAGSRSAAVTSLGAVGAGRATSAPVASPAPVGRVDAVARGDVVVPAGITTGPDGALWFTNYYSDSIGRITTSGEVTAFHDPRVASPRRITTGPDGALWFTNTSGDGTTSIGRITLAGEFSFFPGNFPGGVTAGPDGAVWFTGFNAVGRITTTGQITTYPTNGTTGGSKDITMGPDGALWFTHSFGIGRVTTAGQITSYPVNGMSNLEAITTGPDGALWFTSEPGTSIGRITTDGDVTTFSDPAIRNATGITTGPDGALWFTGFGAPGIGRITTAGQVSLVVSGDLLSDGITAGPDGALWYTDGGRARIGRVTTTGTTTSFSGNGIGAPASLTTGPDGAVWFTNSAGSRIGRLTRKGSLSIYTDDRIVGPSGLTAGPDGAVWFTHSTGIGRITTTGQIATYPTPDSVRPIGITSGPDGALWFTHRSGIGRITTAGQVTTYADADYPLAITAGPDGALWYTTFSGSKVGRIATTGQMSSFFDASLWPVGGISAGSDGALWFGTRQDLVGRITTDGQITTFPATGLGYLNRGMTAGPDDAVWFATQSGAIGRVVTGGVVFHPLPTPTRVLDSRPPPEQVGPYATPWGAGTVRDVQVAGVGGVPASATAVAMNVTVTGTTAPSFLTVWPSGTPRPTASSLNWSAGQTIANAVTVKGGAGGTVSVFNPTGSAHVVIDVVGWYDAASDGDGFVAQLPTRILDSRPPPEQVGPYGTPWGPGVDREVVVAGVGGVPADAQAVVLSATVTGTTAESFLTVYAKGSARPTSSSLNWRARQTVANAVTVKVGDGGAIRAYNAAGDAQVVFDVVGWFGSGIGDAFHPIAPVRFQDSRPAPETVGAYSTPWRNGTTRTVASTTRRAAPAGATAVLANVTVTSASAESFLTVWPTGAPRPTASGLNWTAGRTVAVAVTTAVGSDDTISVFNNAGAVDVVADAAGWYG
ncbi:MAG: hypothetical protein R2726_11875 [Acidimicrobiales bacterium]